MIEIDINEMHWERGRARQKRAEEGPSTLNEGK